jgi:Sperm-tail PG-rich repeat
MNTKKLKNQLENYSNLPKLLDKLHDKGFYNLFHSSFESLRLQDSFFQTIEFKQSLKIIINELIDDIWAQSATPTKTPSHTYRSDTIAPNKSTNPMLHTKTKSVNNLRKISNVTGPATFFKEKRGLDKDIPVTPGPADYSVENLKTRSRSPNAIFTKQKRATEIFNDSPGPSAYSPVTHFQSKY